MSIENGRMEYCNGWIKRNCRRERLTTVDSMRNLHQCEIHPVGEELPYLVKKRVYSTHTIDYEMGRSTVD